MFDEKGFRRKGCQFGGLNKVRQDPSLDPPPNQCFRCWNGEHRQAQCPRKRDFTGIFCFNCGRAERSLVTCERCCDAHERYLRKRAESSQQGRRVRFEEAGYYVPRPQVKTRPTNFASATQVFPQAPLPTQTLVAVQQQLVGPPISPTFPASPTLPNLPVPTTNGPDPVAYLLSQANKPGGSAELRESLHRYAQKLMEECIRK